MNVLAASLESWGTFLGGIGGIMLAVTAIVTAVAAVRTYRQGQAAVFRQQEEAQKQAREATGRWLKELQERFANDESFAMVRRELYRGQDSDLVQALARKTAYEDPRVGGPEPSVQDWEMIVALDDYLDFFAFLKRLIDARQLDRDDAYMLFSWYAISGLQVPAVEVEIERSFHWVRDLRRLFAEMKRAREAASASG
ncbi:MAG TPA: hypothetical protein VF715_01810 [Thermoleophilaceae bacterium]